MGKIAEVLFRRKNQRRKLNGRLFLKLRARLLILSKLNLK